MSLVNSEWLRLIRQFAEMALDLEATKEDIRHEYHAWFAKPTINTCRPRSYMDNEIFNKVARIMDLEARVLARVTGSPVPGRSSIQLVQRWLEQRVSLPANVC